MIKRIIQNLVPRTILTIHKKNTYVKILKNHSIEDEPDIKIAKLLTNKKSSMVDIGLNIGLNAKYLSPCSKKVICIEPVPFTFEMLQHNLKVFQLNNVTAFQIAISDKNGSSEMEIPILSGSHNYYRASIIDNGKLNSGPTFQITSSTLDNFLLNISTPISLIKCDVEGHELSVIHGAIKELEKGTAAWLIEVSDNPDEYTSKAFQLFFMMEKLKYKAFIFDGTHLKKRKKGDSSINYFFLKPSHLKVLSDFL